MRSLALVVGAVVCILPATAVAQSPAAAAAGLTADDWSAITAALDAERHAAHVDDGELQAHNPGQQWTTTFDGRGFTTAPAAGAWTWGLELVAYGWGNTLREAGASAAPVADGTRISRAWDETLTEWYVNDARGLEHGFTVASRPQGARGELTLSLDVRGSLRPEILARGRDVRFADASGAAALAYTGLIVRDADGRELEAAWEASEGDLRLRIADADARYPLNIDPVAQQAYLKAADTGPGDAFGSAVAASLNTVLVGAYEAASTGSVAGGAAYVFVRNGATWTFQAKLTASNIGTGDYFGYSVGLHGDTAVVGAINEDSNATGVNGNQADNSVNAAGAAYVFVRSGTTWTQQAYLKANDVDAVDGFGHSVSISGDWIVVGAQQEDSGATGVGGNPADESVTSSGAAYTFKRTGTTWVAESYLKASNTEAMDKFGSSVAIAGDILVVGAPEEDSSATGVNGAQGNGQSQAGAAYVFVRSGSTWVQQAYLKAGAPGIKFFGSSVSVSGESIAIGAPEDDSNATGVNGNEATGGATNSGAAYVFVRTGGLWSMQAYLKASNTTSADYFGTAVAIAGDVLVVGAPYEDSAATGVNGDQSSEAGPNSGAVYVFSRSGTTWTQQAYVKASNSGLDDAFGRAVAVVAGDLLVAGAPFEDSNATGVNGNQASNSNADAGAAYVLDLDLDRWTDVGFGLAGTSGVPYFFGSGTLVGGSSGVLSVVNAKPSAACTLHISVASTPVPFKGGTLVAFPTILNVPLAVSAAGTITLPFTWPTGLPSGTNLWMQWSFSDLGAVKKVALSNALKATTP